MLAVSGVQAYHQSEFEGLWEQVPQTCINVRAGDTTRDSTAKEMPSWSGYGDVSYRCENDPYCEGRFRVYESDFGRHGWWGDEYDRSDWAKMQAICAWFGDICGGETGTFEYDGKELRCIDLGGKGANVLLVEDGKETCHYHTSMPRPSARRSVKPVAAS